jgi:hypothetical protein
LNELSRLTFKLGNIWEERSVSEFSRSFSTARRSKRRVQVGETRLVEKGIRDEEVGTCS